MNDPILFIPGFLSDMRVFQPQIRALSAERTVIVAPTAGCERIESFASELLSQVPQRFALAGIGLGGAIALELMRRAAGRVSRVALIGSTFQAESPTDSSAREPKIVAAAAGRFDEMLRDHVMGLGYGLGPARIGVQAELTAMGREIGATVFRHHSRAMQRRRDQQTTLRAIRCPTLILGGRHDRIASPKRQEFMAEMVPGAMLKVIEEAGHMVTLEAPEETNAALQDWLRMPETARV